MTPSCIGRSRRAPAIGALRSIAFGLGREDGYFALLCQFAFFRHHFSHRACHIYSHINDDYATRNARDEQKSMISRATPQLSLVATILRFTRDHDIAALLFDAFL